MRHISHRLLLPGLLTIAFGSVHGGTEPAQLPATILHEPPAALRPFQARTERQEDQLLAATHFAQGRLLLRRQSPHRALEHFQRAWRYDPDGVSAAGNIVPLASRLERHSEAARYAILAAERNPSAFPMLASLGAILARQGKYERALRLYEKAAPLDSERSVDARSIEISRQMGRLHLLVGEPEQAAKRLDLVRRALEDPDKLDLPERESSKIFARPEAIYSLLAEAYLQSSNWKSARAMVERANSIKANAAVYAFRMARLAAAQELWDETRQHLVTYSQEHSSAAGQAPYDLLAKVILQSEPNTSLAAAELIRQLTAWSEQDPNNASLGYYLAEQLMEVGDDDAAITYYRRSIDLRPTVDGYRALADLYFRGGDASALLDLLTELVDRSGNLEPLRDELSRFGRDTELVKQVLQLAQKHPSQKARVAGALLAVATSQSRVAERLFRAALEMEGTAQHEVLEAIALATLLADDTATAAKIFEEAIAAEPPPDKLAVYWYYLAGARALEDQYEQAMEAAERAAELNDDPRFQGRPAWVAYHAARYEDAQRRYTALLDRYSKQYGSDDIRDAVQEARFVLSNICIAQDRLPEAEEWLERVLDEDPENTGALNDLGYLWADQQTHLNRALKMVARAVEESPDNAAYRDSLGWAYFHLGRYDEAVRELERAVDPQAPDAVVLDHLGDAYAKIDRGERALRVWQTAVSTLESTGSDDETIAAIRKKIRRLTDRQTER